MLYEFFNVSFFSVYYFIFIGGGGGGVAQSAERATPGEEVLGSIHIHAVAARPLIIWVRVSVIWPAETEVMVSPLCILCGSTYNCQTSVLGPVRDIV